MRMFFYTVSFMTVLFLMILSCGNSGELGTVAGIPVTTDEYLIVFNNLPADMQVSVLEPGGRLELMNRIVMKRSLLSAWQEDQTVSAGWEDLYKTSMLADSMFNRIGFGFDQAMYIDSISACGYSGFSLRAVLLDDSTTAADMAFEWNAGNYDSSVLSLSAPWSLADGSSYRTFSGPVQRITTTFLPLLSMETGTAHVLPMYGEWCVCILNLSEGEWVQDEEAVSMGFMGAVAAATPHVILSRGISSLAASCVVSRVGIVSAGGGSTEPVVLFSNDTLTVADILDIMEKAHPANYSGQVPDELSVFSPPQAFSTKEVALWFYVKAVAQKYGLAELATEQGILLPEDALDYARAESVIRTRVLQASIPDSSEVASWFEENSDMFLMPERRSVLLGYTTATEASDSQTASSFAGLADCQTLVDSSGVMVPTPLRVSDAFGQVLGSAIFAADSGVFSGPVMLEGELAAWFEVIEIAPPDIALLEDVYLQAELLAASGMFSSGFDALMNELFVTYTVTIDTAAVEEIDLWGGTR
ncbi:MAG: peptidylprolyl isomerase [Candidatus Fermentibacteria bacterium]|nr:peptidylprolyl isomerase [Candidatus Fermentibacteria bacterium]